jgi:CubicO group peptidase (beta-lactamase class C family)
LISTESHRRPGFAFLVRNSAAQDQRFRSAFDLLEKAIAESVFPGCALAVTLRGELIAHKGLGKFTYDTGSPPVEPGSIFDLASLTKIVATATMAMILFERGVLDLEAPVAAIVPEFAGDDERRRDVSIRMVLSHSSGLPAYEKLFLQAKTRDDLLAAALAMPLAADPGSRSEYSDIGFIILGMALERLADEPLETFCQREVFGPLGMSHTTFRPPQAWREKIVPTADETHGFRGRVIQGEVQDENASVLGGVGAHAGLFANVEDLAVFAHSMLNGGHPILRPDMIAQFTRRESLPAGTSRALGWDTPSAPSQSGRHLSQRSFGHLGYTGTSLWIDPDRQLSITLLTNRTWPDVKNQAIKQVRPAVYDAVFENL